MLVDWHVASIVNKELERNLDSNWILCVSSLLFTLLVVPFFLSLLLCHLTYLIIMFLFYFSSSSDFHFYETKLQRIIYFFQSIFSYKLFLVVGF